MKRVKKYFISYLPFLPKSESAHQCPENTDDKLVTLNFMQELVNPNAKTKIFR